MSARNRLICGALFCLSPLAIPSPARGQALDSTPRITRGTCPVPHCNLGLWQSATAVPVFAVPGAGKPAFSLRPRVPFEALSGETHAIPGVHVLRGKLDVLDERTTRSLRPGDTVRTIAGLGEGRVSVEAGGRAWTAVMDERDAARFQTVRARQETWWVEVKAPDGRRGWIDGGDPSIAGDSFDETMSPLSPGLDSALLAGLTGPVAAIAREPGLARVTTFEAPVEDARGGEGIAWWSAGRLRMLQLRFRSLLTAAGTTNPAHSGLPAEAVVCCGDLVYQRLIVFTRREPEYVATITMPDQGGRHVVEAFFEDGRMVRLRRDDRIVRITYADSVMGRAWYSAARELVTQVAANTAVPGKRPVGGEAGAAASSSGPVRRLGRMAVVFALVVVAAALAALVAAWQWQRRTRKASHGRAHDALASALAAVTEPEEPAGWVCPYCHADVLLDTDTCWLCGHRRPTEPSPPPPMTICGCGEPNLRDARSCIRCGKPLRPVF